MYIELARREDEGTLVKLLDGAPRGERGEPGGENRPTPLTDAELALGVSADRPLPERGVPTSGSNSRLSETGMRALLGWVTDDPAGEAREEEVDDIRALPLEASNELASAPEDDD